jgi:hypothetical protein
MSTRNDFFYCLCEIYGRPSMSTGAIEAFFKAACLDKDPQNAITVMERWLQTQPHFPTPCELLTIAQSCH